MGKCPNCGAPMQSNTCSYCHYTEQANYHNVSGTVFVNNLYARFNGVSVSTKSKMTTLLLCIFFGIWGAHQFYVGKIGKGLVYLFTCGLFGIGWFIDIIIISCGSFKDVNDLPVIQ